MEITSVAPYKGITISMEFNHNKYEIDSKTNLVVTQPRKRENQIVKHPSAWLEAKLDKSCIPVNDTHEVSTRGCFGCQLYNRGNGKDYLWKPNNSKATLTTNTILLLRTYGGR
jgi:hypothetical protein